MAIPACGGGSGADGSGLVGDAPMATPAEVRFETTAADFASPERGESGWAGDLATAQFADLEREVAEGHPLLRSLVRLDPWRAADLPPQWLDALERGFASVKRAGAKVIPRFAYNNPDESEATSGDPANFTAPDATLDRVLRHIAQIAPVLARQRDAIAFIEAGFIGAWGEWHGSSNRLDSDAGKERIRDALLAAFPADRTIAFRYPADVRRWFAATPPAARRVGFHDDCLLSSDEDGSTWADDPEGLRAYVRASTLAVPFGAETCTIAAPINDCASILATGRSLRLTWLNRYGARERYQEAWRAGGCLATVRRSLGYRFELLQLAVSTTDWKPGMPVRITLDLSNRGWAPLYNPRALQLVLLDPTGKVIERIELPGFGLTSVMPAEGPVANGTFSTVVELPAALATGPTRVAIAAPDPLLGDDPRQAIRFANADRPEAGQSWNAAGGWFETGLTVTVHAR